MIEKLRFVDIQKIRHHGNFILFDPDVARPLAARRAALANVIHTGIQNDVAVSRTSKLCRRSP